MIVTTIAAYFPLILLKMDSLEIPAEYASRNVVVTVEKTMISRPAILSPAFSKICAMSDSPVNSAAPIPMTYIQQLTMPYTMALTAVAFTGFSASLV